MRLYGLISHLRVSIPLRSRQPFRQILKRIYDVAISVSIPLRSRQPFRRLPLTVNPHGDVKFQSLLGAVSLSDFTTTITTSHLSESFNPS